MAQKIVTLDVSATPLSHVDSDEYTVRAVFIYPLDVPVVVHGIQIVPARSLGDLYAEEPQLENCGLLDEETREGLLDGSLVYEIHPERRRKGESDQAVIQRGIARWRERRVAIQEEVHRVWDRYGWSIDPDTGAVIDSNGDPVVLE